MKPAVLPKDLSRWLHEGFALRQQADYAPERRVAPDQAREAVDRAREFVERVRSLLDQRLPPPEPFADDP